MGAETWCLFWRSRHGQNCWHGETSENGFGGLGLRGGVSGWGGISRGPEIPRVWAAKTRVAAFGALNPHSKRVALLRRDPTRGGRGHYGGILGGLPAGAVLPSSRSFLFTERTTIVSHPSALRRAILSVLRGALSSSFTAKPAPFSNPETAAQNSSVAVAPEAPSLSFLEQLGVHRPFSQPPKTPHIKGNSNPALQPRWSAQPGALGSDLP